MSNKTSQHAHGHDDQPKNWLDRLIIKASNLLSWLFIFTVLISFYEVVMRYAFNAPTIWVHETASFIGGSLFIIGGIYAFATNTHVRVVLIYDAVGPRVKKYLNLIHHIVGLAFALMLAYAAYQMTYESWFAPWGELRLERSGSVLNAPYPALLKALIFITLCILSLQYILHLIREVIGLRKHDDV
ncbi:TRAP transporter small permease subunit [Vibrio sp.]|uniref:TRAP transporter small permease subunit n=1 Tax=Vibrio sp. TaxID=678 RepID=UPI003D09FD3D